MNPSNNIFPLRASNPAMVSAARARAFVPFISAEVNLTANKFAMGAMLPAGRFYFGVFDELGDLIVSASNNADGSIIFPTITFSEPDVYHYTIRETTPPGGGWTPDGTVFPVTITVVNIGGDILEAQVDYPAGMPSFVNTFELPPEPVPVTLHARKVTCGAGLWPDMFNIGVFDQNDREVVRAANDACGNFVFPAFMIREPGVYNFTMRELNFSCKDWIMDTREFQVIVTVTAGNGQLTAEISYPGGEPVFINHHISFNNCCV
jgi:pilin isopeptide linkage protein